MLKTKENILKYKEGKIEESEFQLFIENKFPIKLLDLSSDYLKNLDIFIDSYLITSKKPKFGIYDEYPKLKSEITEEINIISNNLLNLKMNAQNSIRFLKDSQYLINYISKVSEISERLSQSKIKIESLIGKEAPLFQDPSYLWIEIQKIKNLEFEIMKNPENLLIWKEIMSLYEFIQNDIENKDIKSKKKENIENFTFITIYNYVNHVKNENQKFLQELFYLLYKNNILFENTKQEFHNIIERKEIKKDLKIFLKPLIKNSILLELKAIIEDIQEFDEYHYTKEKEQEKKHYEQLLKEKISHFFPILIDDYTNGLENYYQFILSEIKDLDKIEEIRTQYSEKMNLLKNKIENIKKYTKELEIFLDPFQDILNSLLDLYDIYLEDISRRKEEFIEYLNINKNEKVKEGIKSFIDKKIQELNILVNEYRDKTAEILSDKFTPLKEINDIINEYMIKINEIKKKVSNKLDDFKEKEIDQYHIIKEWEDNFNRKRQQVGFLLSQFLSKLYKNFGDLIGKEESLFEDITEISYKDSNGKEIPLNYVLSNYLAEKLSEDELKERIIEIKAKINHINEQNKNYHQELKNLENIVEKKVKIREGIEVSNIQCGICRKQINFVKDQLIKCPFCDAVYHYLCVAFWISKYNSCPSCQNAFLDPGSNLFEETEYKDY